MVEGEELCLRVADRPAAVEAGNEEDAGLGGADIYGGEASECLGSGVMGD